MVKNPPTMQEMRIQSLGQEDPLQKEMATHSRILAWKIPQTTEQASPKGSKELDTTEHTEHILRQIKMVLKL